MQQSAVSSTQPIWGETKVTDAGAKVGGATTLVGALVADEIVVAAGFVDAGTIVVEETDGADGVDAGVLVPLSPHAATSATRHNVSTTRDFMRG